MEIQHIDVPGVNETFADAVHELAFDGQTFRIELCVTRMNANGGNAADAASGKRYTTCRLVLPTATALDLSRKLSRVFSAALKQASERKEAVAAPAAYAAPSTPAQTVANA